MRLLEYAPLHPEATTVKLRYTTYEIAITLIMITIMFLFFGPLQFTQLGSRFAHYNAVYVLTYLPLLFLIIESTKEVRIVDRQVTASWIFGLFKMNVDLNDPAVSVVPTGRWQLNYSREMVIKKSWRRLTLSNRMVNYGRAFELFKIVY
jgi:hypothetical protein